jgi:protein gp37
MAHNPHPKLQAVNTGLVARHANGQLDWTGEVRLIPERLDIPLHWQKPRRIFVNSLGDLFHESVPDAWIDQVYAVMLEAEMREQGHIFQVLTKRAERMHAYFAGRPWPRVFAIIKQRYGRHFGAGRLWSPESVWLGVSVENQATADKRIPWLLQTPAMIRFVSYEPALGEVNFCSLDGGQGYRYSALSAGIPFGHYQYNAALDWIIVGGESGPHARPCHARWIADLVEQCAIAEVAVWVKQDSGRRSGMQGRLPDHIWKRKEFPRGGGRIP